MTCSWGRRTTAPGKNVGRGGAIDFRRFQEEVEEVEEAVLGDSCCVVRAAVAVAVVVAVAAEVVRAGAWGEEHRRASDRASDHANQWTFGS